MCCAVCQHPELVRGLGIVEQRRAGSEQAAATAGTVGHPSAAWPGVTPGQTQTCTSGAARGRSDIPNCGPNATNPAAVLAPIGAHLATGTIDNHASAYRIMVVAQVGIVIIY